MFKRKLPALLLSLPLLILAGCGGGGSGSAPGTPAPPNAMVRNFTVALPTTAPVLIPGSTVDVPVTLTRLNGYTGTIALGLSGLPAGITGQFSPASLPGASVTSTLTLSAASNAVTGTLSLNVQASAGDSLTDSKSLAVQVLSRSFTLAAPAPGALPPLYAGAVTNIPIAINRLNGYSGAPALALQNAPAGVSAVFSGQGTDSANMALYVDPATSPGTLALDLVATDSGCAPSATTLSLTLQAAGAQGFLVAGPTAGLNLKPGENRSVPVRINRVGGFAGAVDLVLQGAPAGLGAGFSGSGDDRVLELQAATTLAPGAYNLVLAGTSGGTQASCPVRLQVDPAGQAGFHFGQPADLSLELDGTLSSGLWDVDGQRVSVAALSVPLTRDSGFTEGLRCSLSGVPRGVTVTLLPAAPAGAGSVDLSFKLGPQALPGTYVLTLAGCGATSGQVRDARSFLLTIKPITPDFTLTAVTVDTDGNGNLVLVDVPWVTDLPLKQGAQATLDFYVYTAKGYNTATSSGFGGSVALTLENLPEGVTGGFDVPNPRVDMDVPTLSLSASGGVPNGVYPVRIKAEGGGKTHYFDFALTVADGTFYVKRSPVSAGVTLAAGQSLTLPVELGRQDTFFTINGMTGAPSYLGNTDLSTVDLPTGLSASFGQSGSTSATASLTLSAAPSLAPGDYTVTLRATRNGANNDLTLPVKVTAASGTPDLWIQNVEWGQTVLQSGLRLVEGKSALLRAHVLADRPGIGTVVVRATVKAPGMNDLVLTLDGPATAPTSVAEGQLGQTYTKVVPREYILPGMSVDITVDPDQAISESSRANNSVHLTPAVGAGRTLDLVAVPIVHQGVVATLPTDQQMQDAINRFWPTKGVSVTRRAPYITSLVLPQSNSNNASEVGAAWAALDYELASLRLMDGASGLTGSSAHYFGFVHHGLYAWTGGNLGIHMPRIGAGIGLDDTIQIQEDTQQGLRTSVSTMIHELGHGWNLQHAPAGGAGGPSTHYPYRGAKTGTWGYDPLNGTLYDPDQHVDVMCYVDLMSNNFHQWTSDFSYLNAFSYFENIAGRNMVTSALAPRKVPCTVVSGYVDPQGRVSLHPVQHVEGEPRRPGSAGSHTLRIRTASGVREIGFDPEQLDCLSTPGHQLFFFLLEGQEEVLSAEVRKGGQSLFQARPAMSLKARGARLMARSAPGAAPLAQERDGCLELDWDAEAHPYASVVFEDAGGTRMGLALNLRNGRASLPTRALPSGGRFRVSFSDGLNPVERIVERAGGQ